MTDVFAATDSGILVPTRLRTQVIPWQALNALNPPMEQPQVSTDILSTFAVMVAQGPRAPALVGTDEHSNLLVNAEINQHSTVGRPQSVGDLVVMVSDPTFGGAGDVFLVIPQSGNPAHGPYQVSGQGQDADGTIHLLFGLQQNIAVGDGVRRLPLIGISGALNTVFINSSSAVGSLVWTANSFSAAGINGQPTSFTTTSLAATGTSVIRTGAVTQQIFPLSWFLTVEGQTAGRTVAFLQDQTAGVPFAAIVCPSGVTDAAQNGNLSNTALTAGGNAILNVLVIGTGATVRAGLGAITR